MLVSIRIWPCNGVPWYQGNEWDESVSVLKWFIMREVEAEIRESVRVQSLLDALQICSNEELLLRFLRDLLTYEEIQQLANRWAAAHNILEGKSQQQTVKELSISSKTVGNAYQWTNGPYGTGGFIEVYEKIKLSNAGQEE
jgi:uncharacterized protein YerC